MTVLPEGLLTMKDIASSNGSNDGGENWWRRNLYYCGSWIGSCESAKTAGVSTVAAVSVTKSATVALSLAGFTSKGIAANSVASGIAHYIGGNMAAGSWFSILQSIGASGGVAVASPVGLLAAISGGAGYVALNRYRASTSKIKEINWMWKTGNETDYVMIEPTG